MTVAANNIKNVTELVNYINANLKNSIQGNIVWHQGNPPPYFPGTWYGILKPNAALPDIAVGNIGAINGKPTIASLYSGLQSLLVGWSTVKRFRFLYYNGNQGQYSLVYDATQFANFAAGTVTVANGTTPGITANANTSVNSFSGGGAIAVAFQSDIFNNTPSYKQAANTLVVSSTITSLISALYNTWAALGTEQWQYVTCHTNCHRNCHGSGGTR